MDITVCIPTIPPRVGYFERALRSVNAQHHPAASVLFLQDVDRCGACATRNTLLDRVATEWVAFLDDDDELLPQHLGTLADATHSGADVYYPWFEVVGARDPLGRFGQPFSAADLQAANYVPVTVLARTEVLRAVGGFQPPPWASPDNPCEDWGAWLAVVAAGGAFEHVPRVTWRWHHHGQNTSGLPRW